MPPPPPSLGLLIIAARQAIRQAVGARARSHRLTTQQFWAVYGVRRIPGITPGELGAWMLLDAPAASRLVADLCKRKLLELQPDRADRRRTRLFLTQKGAALGEDVQRIADDYLAAQTRGLTEEEVRVTRATLQKVVDNLAGFAAPAPGA